MKALKNIFKIAKQMKEESQDLPKMCCVKDTKGNVVSKPEEVRQRWRMTGITIRVATKGKGQ